MLQEKVTSSPNACKIGLFFSSDTVISDDFFNTIVPGDLQEGIYLTSGSLKFKESSKQGPAGVEYSQTVEFTLPTSDELRSKRIHQFVQVRLIAVKLTNGSTLFFGRNDVIQNTKPKIKIVSDEKLTKIEFKQKSIYPLGFLNENLFTFQDGTPFIFQDGTYLN